MTNKRFILHLLGIVAFLFLVLFLTIWWLRIYTHHGQKLEVPDYIETHMTDAARDADRRSFELIVNDSVHIVGKPGGLIQNQNPKPGAMVKENRKIYVMTTKYNPDKVDLATIYPLWGQDYDSKRKQLQQLAISTEVKEYKYDLTNNTILEVWHNGQKIIDREKNPQSYPINRGDRLEMVVSSPRGGAHIIPNVIGRKVKDARWAIEAQSLQIGSITFGSDLGVSDVDEAIIVAQEPEADGSSTLPTGGVINITIKSGQ